MTSHNKTILKNVIVEDYSSWGCQGVDQDVVEEKESVQDFKSYLGRSLSSLEPTLYRSCPELDKLDQYEDDTALGGSSYLFPIALTRTDSTPNLTRSTLNKNVNDFFGLEPLSLTQMTRDTSTGRVRMPASTWEKRSLKKPVKGSSFYRTLSKKFSGFTDLFTPIRNLDDTKDLSDEVLHLYNTISITQKEYQSLVCDCTVETENQ